MAIFFGDELRSSNKDFPIIDISENNAKGVIFVKDITNPDGTPSDDVFSATNVPYGKITKGVILVDRATGNVYIYKDGFTNGVLDGNETTGNDNPDEHTLISSTPNGAGTTSFFTVVGNDSWKQIGNTPTFSGTIVANIGEIVNGIPKTFGKYKNQDVIDFSGLTALEAIENALTSHIEMQDSDVAWGTDSSPNDGFAGVAEYDPAGGSVTVDNAKFTVFNPNRKALPDNAVGDAVKSGVRKIEVFRPNFANTSFASCGVLEFTYTNDGAGSWTKTGVLNTDEALAAVKKLNQKAGENEANGNEPVTFTFTDTRSYGGTTAESSTNSNGEDKIEGYKVVVTPVTQEADSNGNPVDQANEPEQDAGLVVTTNQGKIKVTGMVQTLVALTVTREDTTSSKLTVSGDLEENSRRELGNIESNISVSITKKDADIDIDRVKITRTTKGIDAATDSEVTIFDTDGDATLGTYTLDIAVIHTVADSDTLEVQDDDGNVTTYGYNGEAGNQLTETEFLEVEYKVYLTQSVTRSDGTTATITNDVKFTDYDYDTFLPIFVGYSQTDPSQANAPQLSTAITSIYGNTVQHAKQATSGFAESGNRFVLRQRLERSAFSGDQDFGPTNNNGSSSSGPEYMYLANTATTNANLHNEGSAWRAYLCIPKRVGTNGALLGIQEINILKGGTAPEGSQWKNASGNPWSDGLSVELTNAFGATHEYVVLATTSPDSFTGAGYSITS